MADLWMNKSFFLRGCVQLDVLQYILDAFAERIAMVDQENRLPSIFFQFLMVFYLSYLYFILFSITNEEKNTNQNLNDSSHWCS